VIVAFFIAVAVVGPIFAPYAARSYRPLYQGAGGQPPSLNHPFGVEESGIDVFSEVVHSARNDLYVGLAASLLTTLIGVAIGALAGYFKGAVSDVLLGLTQIFFVFPALLLILLFARVFSVLVFKGLGLTLIVLILSFFGWSGIAFIVRGETLRVREMDFVQAARSLGAGSMRILFRHIIPNILSPVIVITTLGIAGFILTEVAVSFLGFGDANTPTWGLILNEGFPFIRTEW
jgi:ABC-type dipeptide/oligopeptide/nickel transport system permease subunit